MKFRLGNPDKGGFAQAFARGLCRHGWRATERVQCDLLVLWGTRRQHEIIAQKQRGGEVLILERAYLGDRYAWTSVSFGGGLNGRGIFKGPLNDPRRWNKHFSHLMKPWQPKEDGYALILQQVPGDMSVRGVQLDRFYAQAADAFRRTMPVKVRPHPRTTPLKDTKAHEAGLRSLQTDLAGARLAVTWNSNAGVEAVLAGIPTIAMDVGSMAWEVTTHKLKIPSMPDRQAWAHSLANMQWLISEFEDGSCWSFINGGQDNSRKIGQTDNVSDSCSAL